MKGWGEGGVGGSVNEEGLSCVCTVCGCLRCVCVWVGCLGMGMHGCLSGQADGA